MYFDAHTHVHFAAFKEDSKEVIRRALDAEVWLVTVGTQKDTSRKAVEVASEYDKGVYAAIGLHPVHTSKSFHDEEELGGGEAAKSFTSRGEVFDHGYYLNLAKNPKTVAIGECGLDYYRMEGDGKELKEKQKQAFELQIELAKEVKKPLMIHCRDAFSDVLDMLKALSAPPSVAHQMVRTVNEAKKLLDLGYYFTFSGNITFKPKPDKPAFDEVIKYIPLDRILTETDAPYLAPAPYRGKRNEPAYVIEVVKKLAELKNLSQEDMAAQIFANAKRIFKI